MKMSKIHIHTVVEANTITVFYRTRFLGVVMPKLHKAVAVLTEAPPFTDGYIKENERKLLTP